MAFGGHVKNRCREVMDKESKVDFVRQAMASRPDKAGKSAPATAEQIEFVRQMLLELRRIAADSSAPTLVYLLEMSVIEASEVLKAQRQHSTAIDVN